MGQTVSQERKLYLKVVQQVLRASGYCLSEKRIAQLLLWVKENCSWFPSEGTLDSTMWKRVGEHLQTRRKLGFDLPDSVLVTWQFVYSALVRLQPAETVAQREQEEEQNVCEPAARNHPAAPFGSGPTDPEREADLYPPSPETPVKPEAVPVVATVPPCPPSLSPLRPTAPVSLPHSPVPNSSDPFLMESMKKKLTMQKYCEDEMNQGDFTSVVHSQNERPVRDGLPYQVLKELKKSVTENGLQSRFTTGMLEFISTAYDITPWDWKTLMKIILPPVQYALWQLEYDCLVMEQAVENIASGVPVHVDMLAGTGEFLTPQARVGLDRRVFEQTARVALWAWRRVPETGRRAGSFAAVWQGSQEPYVTFIDRLQTAVAGQVESPGAAEALLLHLAFENANSDCQAALLPIKGKETDIGEYVRTCQNVGTETDQISVLAKALAQLQVNQSAIKCFNCGQQGHVSKECPKKKGNTKGKQPTRLCPRCQKGYHWGSQCRSKYDKFGQPLSENCRRGARPGAPQASRAPSAHTDVDARVQAADAGCAALDLAATHDLTFTESQKVHLANSGVWGPLPNGFVGLLVGRCSLYEKGALVLPDVIDSDYTGEIKMRVMAFQVPCRILANQKIAQILFIPYWTPEESSTVREQGGFGSAGPARVLWSQQITMRQPLLTLTIQGKKFTGLLDTGADVSIISRRDWPAKWPLEVTAAAVSGIGGMQIPLRSAVALRAVSPDKATARIRPYVLDTALNLWGRDLLRQWHVTLTTARRRKK